MKSVDAANRNGEKMDGKRDATSLAHYREIRNDGADNVEDGC